MLLTLSMGNTQPEAENFSTIEIVNAKTGRIYGRRNIEKTGEFAIEFIHSVNNSTVREIYRLEEKEIRSTAVRFYSFGAGMQAELEDGQQIIRDGDALVITGLSRIFPELNYIVGTVSDHILLINNESISLGKLCGKNTPVTLRVK